MNPGYIYVLQNAAYGAYVVKIGLTKREPNVRAREIYTGSSGVPVPFDIAVAYSVSDCVKAEKRIHKRLAAYRLNQRREFFRTSPSVAASIAYETCAQVNVENGDSPPRPYVLPPTGTLVKSLDSVVEIDGTSEGSQSSEMVDPGLLRESPVGTSTLTPEQLDRARILGMQLARVHPRTYREWYEGFSRDAHPERELQIWEHITKAYLTIEQVEFASDALKTEAFALLLQRSWSSTDEVLKETRLEHFTPMAAKRLLRSYELRPKPIVIMRGCSAV